MNFNIVNMNIRGGWGLVRKNFYSYMSSQGFFWTLAIAWMMGPLVYMFVWVTAVGQGTVAGFGRNDFVLYYSASLIINQLTYPTSNWIVGEGIRSGTISVWLLRPLPVIYEAIAADVAVKAVSMPFVVILSIALGLVLGAALPLGPLNIMMFLVSLGLALVLRFLFFYTIALLAFWTQRIDALLVMANTFVFVFSGQVAPVAVLQGFLKHAAVTMPFRYMIGFPLEILTGKLTPPELITGMILQSLWLGLVYILYRLTWIKGVKAYTAVGG